MKKYFAISKEDKQGTYLSVDKQMDKYLALGWDIYEEDAGVETLIATPEKGFLIERPVFPVTEIFRIGG